ncbi:uncharacterized protein LOC130664103 [Microplitis mediator]|uniref:uncharacterized protein LOC130664103 n=1 Tax=Microplitis mediator TaxID=375433 RepID=UPI002556487D|nr:uncharacterized protein LOC130664103 [Microplitis mediator]
MQMVKQLGRWRSDSVAMGYIENSMHNREMIYNGITQKSGPHTQTKLPSSPQVSSSAEVINNPRTNFRDEQVIGVQVINDLGTNSQREQSTSKPAINNSGTISRNEQLTDAQTINNPGTKSKDEPSTIEQVNHSGTDNGDFTLDWTDFEEDFTVDDVNSIPQDQSARSGFTTASNHTIPLPVINQNDINNNNKQLLTKKPSVKLAFNHQKTINAPLKKIENTDKRVTHNNNDITSIMKGEGLKLKHCTLNNCVFNLNLCSCNKEN